MNIPERCGNGVEEYLAAFFPSSAWWSSAEQSGQSAWYYLSSYRLLLIPEYKDRSLEVRTRVLGEYFTLPFQVRGGEVLLR